MTSLVVLLAVVLLTTACKDQPSEAESLVAKGKLAKAESLYRKALAENPEDVAALDGLAVVLMLKQEYDEALIIQEKVSAAEPNNVPTRLELGFNYLNHQGRPGDAVRVFKEAVNLEDSGRNLTFLAQAQTAAGDTPAAEQSLWQAIEVDPTYPYAYEVLVGLLRETGRATCDWEPGQDRLAVA